MNRDKLIELIRFTAGEIEPKEISIECAESILIDFEQEFYARKFNSLDEAIKKAKPNLDKITDVDKHLDDIR